MKFKHDKENVELKKKKKKGSKIEFVYLKIDYN